jgi:rod shape-determining protein MreD
MRHLGAVLLVLVLVVLARSLLPGLRPLGTTPDLLLVLVACWAALRAPGEAMLLAPFAGLVLDLASGYPLGVSVLALAVAVLVTSLKEVWPLPALFPLALLAVALGTLTFHLVLLSALAASGEGLPWWPALWRGLLPALVVNGIATPLLYLPLRWLWGRQPRREASAALRLG